MKYWQKKASEGERVVMQQLANDLNQHAPHVTHGPGMLPCHIIPEWHHSVVVVSPSGHTGIYRCQGKFWSLELSAQQARMYAGWAVREESDVHLAILNVGSWRDDLGSIRMGTAGLALIVGEAVTGLKAARAPEVTHPPAPLAPASPEQLDDDELWEEYFNETSEWYDQRFPATEEGRLCSALNVTAEDEVASNGMSLVSADEKSGIFLGYGTDEGRDSRLYLRAYPDSQPPAWVLALERKLGDADGITNRWSAVTLNAGAPEIARRTTSALAALLSQHDGPDADAIREARLTWAAMVEDIPLAMALLTAHMGSLPDDDANAFYAGLPRNLPGLEARIKGSSATTQDQKDQLAALVEDIDYQHFMY